MLLVPLDKNKVYKGQKFKQYVEEKMQYMFGKRKDAIKYVFKISSRNNFLNRYQRFYSCFLYVLIQMVWCSSGLARYTSVLLNTQRCILSFNIIYANAATQEVANRHIAWDKKNPAYFQLLDVWTFDKPVLDKLIMYIILIPLPVLFLF